MIKFHLRGFNSITLPVGYLVLPHLEGQTVKSLVSLAENALPTAFSPWDIILENPRLSWEPRKIILEGWMLPLIIFSLPGWCPQVVYRGHHSEPCPWGGDVAPNCCSLKNGQPRDSGGVLLIGNIPVSDEWTRTLPWGFRTKCRL